MGSSLKTGGWEKLSAGLLDYQQNAKGNIKSQTQAKVRCTCPQ